MNEIRYDFLNDLYVVISPERAKRPHEIKEKETENTDIKNCPFEYGNEDKTPPAVFTIEDGGKWKVRVIPNKYPILSSKEHLESLEDCLSIKMGGYGFHEVIIETPEHFKKPFQFQVCELKDVLTAYQERMKNLYRNKNIKYVHIFKNYKPEAGSSLSHPHSQLIALPFIPEKIQTQLNQLLKYREEKNICFLCDEIKCELDENKRVLFESKNFLVYCPFASNFPFKIRIIPKKHQHTFLSIDEDVKEELAQNLIKAFSLLNNYLHDPPFNLVLYSLASNKEEIYHWYMEIIPRITTLGGFEIGTQIYTNIVSPEDAVKLLKVT